MTIIKRAGLGYAAIAAVCLVLVSWLAYHEFVEEPKEFAERGVPELHKDVSAELSTVIFLAAVPALLGIGWLWMHRILKPLRELAGVVEKIDTNNLREPIPRSMNDDEVDKLTAGFNSMMARLDQSFNRIHEFTLSASHELKTPLTIMRAQLETALRDGASLPAEQTAWIDGQIDEVRRHTHIVDSLTLLTKADAGLLELERRPVHLREIVDEAFDDAKILADAHGIKVTLDERSDIEIAGDRHRLRQLLLILSDNAVKYNRPNGTIVIALRKADGMAELRITNTSKKLNPKSLEKVFTRFVRGENAQGHVEGCGLGLTIAQWIVQSHGGTIQLLAETDESITALVRLPIT